jgi:hypothetical protein
MATLICFPSSSDSSLTVLANGRRGASTPYFRCLIRFFILRERSYIDNLRSTFYHHGTKPGHFLKKNVLIKNYSQRTAAPND